ncbi:sodium-dependent transporter [Mobilicoccus caccae]|uniref:Sodium-dependent transporter n=1 Tax=Mobilicoccus caccae TaxID=1859295 RepID=A0ABQ6ITY6_9MICO|nr:sodium-dependent transporter [Mobilicoccus caccae]GMA41409.1 sodium-dependent transporter [Mobilicoccus caccae]
MTVARTVHREAFSSRTVFILAAIGSAVGLGNIWRYPYVAYSSGGGAFLIPYLVALLTAGIPLLFLDYALGHKFRGSPPLAFRRLSRWTEPFGWVQVLMCLAIATFYACVIAWAASYAWFSLTLAWGDDAEAFFAGTFLQQGEATMFGGLVPTVAIPLVLVWVVNIAIVAIGVERGIGRLNRFLLPLLIALFIGLVIRSLFLPGAMAGLDAFFTPNWAALGDPQVWIAAYGQIFFSLSVAFGAMLTYASHLKRRTNLTASGLVVGFSNSAFEVLAGIGVFAALGFLAAQSGVPVSEAAAGGPGLAFVAFPTLISQMPFGQIFGSLFFLTLVFAGITSLVSILQPPAMAISEKFGISHRAATLSVGTVAAIVSISIFPTTTGLNTLDVVDNWINNVLLVSNTLVMVVVVVWVVRKTPMLARHLNGVGSFKIGGWWTVCLGIVTPLILGWTATQSVITLLRDGYEDLPGALLATFGWGVVGGIVVLAVLMTFVPWRNEDHLAAGVDLDDPREEAEAARVDGPRRDSRSDDGRPHTPSKEDSE